MIARQGILSQFYLPFNPLSLLALCRHHRASRSVAVTLLRIYTLLVVYTDHLFGALLSFVLIFHNNLNSEPLHMSLC